MTPGPAHADPIWQRGRDGIRLRPQDVPADEPQDNTAHRPERARVADFQRSRDRTDLSYVYDPIGNITRIADAALKAVFSANQQVDSASNYFYDPLFRLIQATGREHISQSAFAFAPPDGNYRDYPFVGATQQSDLQALRNYTELYAYDPVGNFLTIAHQAVNGNWTRTYAYSEESLTEPAKQSNRLSQTALETGAIRRSNPTPMTRTAT